MLNTGLGFFSGETSNFSNPEQAVRDLKCKTIAINIQNKYRIVKLHDLPGLPPASAEGYLIFRELANCAIMNRFKIFLNAFFKYSSLNSNVRMFFNNVWGV